MTGLSRSRVEAIIHEARKKLESSESVSNDTCVITNIPSIEGEDAGILQSLLVVDRGVNMQLASLIQGSVCQISDKRIQFLIDMLQAIKPLSPLSGGFGIQFLIGTLQTRKMSHQWDI